MGFNLKSFKINRVPWDMVKGTTNTLHCGMALTLHTLRCTQCTSVTQLQRRMHLGIWTSRSSSLQQVWCKWQWNSTNPYNHKSSWLQKYMELYRSWLHKKQIELVTLTTTSIAIELGRPKTHKKWGAFLNNGKNDMRGDVAMKSNI